MTLAGTTITQTLFGAERFNYSSTTYTRTFSCPSTQGSFTLKVINGDGHDDHFASSTLIKVNNTTIVGSGDLGSSTRQVSKSVNNLVQGNNTLTVKVNGHSGDYLTVTINGVYTLDVQITSPVSGAQLTANHTSVQGTYLAYTSNFNISVDNISASASSGNFNVPSVPLVSGSNLIRAVIATTHGLTDQDNVTVNDNLPPVAEAGPGQTVRTGESVALDGRGSSDPENAPIGYQWSFAARPVGSQSVLAGPNTVGPYFVPDLAGSYVAQLIVNDGVQNGLPDNVSVVAANPNTPPTAVAGASQNVSTGSQVFLDGSGSFDPDTDPITYAWSMTGKPQQSQAALSNPLASAPTFVADEDGAYLLELVVNDGQANSSPDNVTVVAVPPNVPPTAYAGPDALAARNTLVHLDGSESFDPEEQALSWSWTLVSRPEGSSALLVDATTLSPAFLPDGLGDYVFRLVVNDGVFDSAPDTVIVTAVNVPPVAVAVAAATDVPVNTAISLDGSGSHDANNDPITYSWSLTSAPTDSTASVSNSASAFATITPDVAGSYTISLIVNDRRAIGAPAAVLISAFIPPVNVPDVVGMSQAVAQDAISGAGLTVGTITPASSDTVPSGNVISQSPAAGSMTPPGSPVNITVSSGPLMVAVPVVLGMTQNEAQAALVSVPLSLGTVTTAFSDTVASDRVISQSPPSGTTILHDSPVALVISQGAESVIIPPDPATVATPVDKTTATGLLAASRFLYSGPNPIQTGVSEGAIDFKRVAVLKGKVSTRDGLPLSGVSVSVTDHPEAGKTVTRIDGRFDLVINGGGLQNIQYSKPGYLQVQRQMKTPWMDYAHLPDVVMIPYDSQVTTVDLTRPEPIQVVRGTVVNDQSGTRQATLLFPRETQVQMVFPDGTTRPVNSMSIRATEYTVGLEGPKAMPAPLPPSTGYTYCVELSVDEAVVAGADGIRFDQPIPFYIENFIGFPVGTPVPVGYYDSKRGTWIPSNNGRVIKIVGITGGMVDLDTNGDGVADGINVLAGMGITDIERTQLVATYSVGTSLWRAPISHFSTIDLNYPVKPATGGATSPDVPQPPGGEIPSDPVTGGDPCTSGQVTITDRSTILCQGQVLGEEFSVAGTPFSLVYRSDRVPGRKDNFSTTIPITGETIPPDVQGIDVEISIAGKLEKYHLDRDTAIADGFLPNLAIPFTWDGLDSNGRELQGAQPVTVRIGYIYKGMYAVPPEISQSFNLPAESEFATIYPAQDIALWSEWKGKLGTWDARAQGFGGWTLSPHHAYDPFGKTIHLGGGGQSGGDGASTRVISTVAGVGSDFHTLEAYDGAPATSVRMSPYDVSTLPNGGLLVGTGHQYFRFGPDDNILHLVAGSRFAGGSTEDGVLATQASLGWAVASAVDRKGNIYIADIATHRVRKVDADGIITTVAGNGTGGTWDSGAGDGGPATAAILGDLAGLAVGPDDGLYILSGGRVRKVLPDNTIVTIAGGGGPYVTWGWEEAMNGCRAKDVSFWSATGIAMDTSGNLYVADAPTSRVFRIDPYGTLTSFAGGGAWGNTGDGGPASLAALVVRSLASGPDGSLYIAGENEVRRVSPNGIITTFAGDKQALDLGDGGLAIKAWVGNTIKVAIGNDDSLYIADFYSDRVRKVGPVSPGFSGSDLAVVSNDGKELYVFDENGKHLRTTNVVTGALKYRFDYDPIMGTLAQITDGDGNDTNINHLVRYGKVNPDRIDAPGGQSTRMLLNSFSAFLPGTTLSDGYLGSITNPAGNSVSMDYHPLGLLNSFHDLRRYQHLFEYDNVGRLLKDTDPEGGFLQLDRSLSFNDNLSTLGVSVTSTLGRVTDHSIEYHTDGSTILADTSPDGSARVQKLLPDGSSEVTLSNGAVIHSTTKADPRFGMQAPYTDNSTIRTPQGLELITLMNRSVKLANPYDLMSLQSQTDSSSVNGQPYSRRYDLASGTVTSVSPVGRTSIVAVDNQGRPLSVQRASLLPVNFAYEQGRLSRMEQDNNSWDYDYDSSYRLWKVTDPLDRITEYGYDNADRVNLVRLPSGRSYGFEYDAAGNRTKIVMPNLAEHRLDYSPVNLDNSYGPPSNPAYTHGYSPDREWKRTTLPSGRAVTADYETVKGRLLSVAYPEASNVYGYLDNDDRLYSVTRTGIGGTQAIAYGYDGFLVTSRSFSGVSNGEYRYAYDNNFSLMEVALDSSWNLLSRDNDGLLTGFGPFTISRGGPAGAPDNVSDLLSRACAVDVNGDPAMCPGGTMVQSFGYDNVGRLNRRTSNVNGIIAYEEQLERDVAGRISGKTERFADNTTVLFNYFYDVDGQLDNVVRDGALYEKYGYDLNGNRTSAHGPTLLQVGVPFDDQDRETGESMSFDVDGNLTRRGNRNFIYSTRGELLAVTDNTTGFPVVSYAYDGMNRRVARTDSNGQTTQYLYGNLGQPFQVTASRAPGNVLTNFFYDDFGALYALERGGVRYYVASDHLGTPKVVTDNTGYVLDVMTYDSFGNRITGGTAFDLPVGFAGGLVDNATTMVRFGFRDYEPEAGRWAAKDPIFHAGGLNLYQYVANDPVNYVDRDGKCLSLIVKIAVGVYAIYEAYDSYNKASEYMALNNLLEQNIDWANKMMNSLDPNENNYSQKMQNLKQYEQQVVTYQAALTTTGAAGLYASVFKQVLGMPIPR